MNFTQSSKICDFTVKVDDIAKGLLYWESMKPNDVFNFPEILWRADNFLGLRMSRII